MVIIIQILLFFISFFSPVKSKNKPERLPNIVLIFTDDQGYGDVGIYGGKEVLTPNLDQMAEEGIRFTNFYVAQAVCSASRAALLTGTYANRLGIHGALDHRSTHGLNPDETTIAEMLKPLGYATAIYGKWHLGHHLPFLPTSQGFDEFFGIPYSNDMWPYHPQTPDYYPPLPLIQDSVTIGYFENDQSLFTRQLTEKAVSFIDKNKKNPFFLYLPHPMPHVPLFVSERFAGKSGKGLYADVIMELDWSVGEILKALAKNDIEENTLVIFLSDNGPWLSYSLHSGSTAGLKEGKGTSWDGGVKVPAIMRWPGTIPAGLIQKQPAMSIDLLPTLAEITGATLPGLPIDGKSIYPMLVDENTASPQEAYFIYYNTNELQAVVMGEWKLYFPHKYRTLVPFQGLRNDGIPLEYKMVDLDKMELYHIPSDPEERKDVLEDNPKQVREILKWAEKARRDMGDALTGEKGVNLRKPGYLLP
jgi:arylsulfatase A-like enzyme